MSFLKEFRIIIERLNNGFLVSYSNVINGKEEKTYCENMDKIFELIKKETVLLGK